MYKFKSFLLKKGLTLKELCSFKLIFSDKFAKKLTDIEDSKELILGGSKERGLQPISNRVISNYNNNYKEVIVGSRKLVESKIRKIYCIYVLGRGWSSWYNCFFNLCDDGLLKYVFSVRSYLDGGTVLNWGLKKGVVSGFIRGVSSKESIKYKFFKLSYRGEEPFISEKKKLQIPVNLLKYDKVFDDTRKGKKNERT